MTNKFSGVTMGTNGGTAREAPEGRQPPKTRIFEDGKHSPVLNF